MKKYGLLLLWLTLSLPLAAQENKTTDKRLAGIDVALSRLLQDWHVAGFAVAVVEKDKVIYSKGFGYRDYENKKPVTPHTLFAIGSSTKAFTCGLVGLLEKDGKVSLDNTIRDYLPDLHFFNDNMDANITVRDMMCHRTGLSRYDYSWYLFNTKARDSMLRRVKYMEPTAGIRERWQYNNFMFLGQGVLVEKLTGHSWEDNIRERYFVPLEMSRSNLSIEALQKDADASLGYKLKNDSMICKTDYYDIAGMGPAGSINSSVEEMTHWVTMWINNGKYKGKEVLPPLYIKDAISAQMVVDDGLPDKEHPDIHGGSYGLGWFLSSYKGHYLVEHGGNIDGFSANVAFFPGDSIGIVVLSNQNTSVVPVLARNLIADKILGLKYTDWSSEKKKAVAKARKRQKEAEQAVQKEAKPVTQPSHPLKDYEGIYSNPAYGDMTVTLKQGALRGTAGRQDFYLRHDRYDIFEVKWIDKVEGPDTTEGGMKVIFRYDESGKITMMEAPFEGGVKPLEFRYKPAAQPLTAEELTKYTGDYELSGVVIKVYAKGAVLYLHVPGQPDYETIPTGNHSFTLKQVEGFSIRFEPDDKGVMAAVLIIQPNGTFKAKRK